VSDKRLAIMSVRISDDEKELFDQAAREQRLSLSQWVRRTLKLQWKASDAGAAPPATRNDGAED
jgi:predicted HicB family RNase H-like nuclease